MSGLPKPELHSDAKFVFLSDWDGTISDKDSNDYLVDNLGFGAEQRRAYNPKIISGELNFRDSFREMLASVSKNHSFEECKQLLRENIKLDPGFPEFYDWCKANGIPVIIVSSGMAPLIRAVLEKHMGAEAANIEIIANDVMFTDAAGKGTSWEVVYRHPESGFGHDKSQSILPYRHIPSRPTLFFAGDGVSDLSAARHSDLLFTKVAANGDSDLLKYCKQEGIPNVSFRHFDEVLAYVKEVVAGTKTPKQILDEKWVR